jgi:hypothetical protein
MGGGGGVPIWISKLTCDMAGTAITAAAANIAHIKVFFSDIFTSCFVDESLAYMRQNDGPRVQLTTSVVTECVMGAIYAGRASGFPFIACSKMGRSPSTPFSHLA